MMFKQLSVKYRPRYFQDVDGQQVSVQIMKNSILMDRVAKAMILSGIRGTGKTTLARIYAKALNCEKFESLGDVCNECTSCLEADNGTHPDIIEFDAASNNGVDFVRDLEVTFRQVETFKRRVIIFDEVHMFTSQAQSALLKTLEEPPRNLTFILSTTDPEKLEDTIRSRCLSMPLKPLAPVDIAQNLRRLIQAEGRVADESFIQSLSMYGGGSLRDVQQILDQLILVAGDECLTDKHLEESLGIISSSTYRTLAPILCSVDLKVALDWVEHWYQNGVDLEQLYLEGIPNLLRDFTVVLSGSWSPQVALLSGIPAEVIQEKVPLSLEYIKYISTQWEHHRELMKTMSLPKVVWTMFFVSIFKQASTASCLPDY